MWNNDENLEFEFKIQKRATFIDFTNKILHFVRFLSALTLKIRNFGPELEKSDIFVQCGLGFIKKFHIFPFVRHFIQDLI